MKISPKLLVLGLLYIATALSTAQADPPRGVLTVQNNTKGNVVVSIWRTDKQGTRLAAPLWTVPPGQHSHEVFPFPGPDLQVSHQFPGKPATAIINVRRGSDGLSFLYPIQ